MPKIPRSKHASGNLIVYKVARAEVNDIYDMERDDLIMLVLEYAETEGDFQQGKFKVGQFAFPLLTPTNSCRACMTECR